MIGYILRCENKKKKRKKKQLELVSLPCHIQVTILYMENVLQSNLFEICYKFQLQ
jgi:hypothetical protein